jgi:hypothetical protein
VMSQDSKQCQYTEDHTTSCSQHGHTRFGLSICPHLKLDHSEIIEERCP